MNLFNRVYYFNNTMAKSLINLSMKLRNITALPRQFSTVNVCYNQNKLEISEISEQQKQNVKKANSIKELFDILKTDINPTSLVTNIDINRHMVDGRHVVTALTSMYNYYKKLSIPEDEMRNSEHFKKLCFVLSKKLLSLDSPQRIQALKILNLIKVPTSTTLVQLILQLVRGSVNELNLSEIFYMSYLLQHMDRTPLTNVLSHALPEVFKAQYKLQIDRDNLKELKSSLRFASDYVSDKDVIEYLVNAIDDFNGFIDLDSAVHIFWSLSMIKQLPQNYLSVLNKVKKAMLKNLHIMNKLEVTKTIKHMCLIESSGIPGFYDPVLLDKLVDKIIEMNMDFLVAVMSLNNLNRIGHIHKKLLDYLSYQCNKNQNLVTDNHALCLITLTVGFSYANYTTKNWDLLKKLFSENHARLASDIRNYVYFAVNLAALDYFDSTILETAFKLQYHEQLFKNDRDHKFKRLYYCAKILYPEYSGPWPTSEVVESFKDATICDYAKPVKYLLLPALENILKDSSLIKTNLITKEGIYIDHLIILKNGRPVAFENAEPRDSYETTINVEDLNIPEELKRVAVLQLPPEVYGKNIKILQASVHLIVKLLKALSYQVVTVSEQVWNNLPENEMIPYIQNLLDFEMSESVNSIENK